MWERSPGFSAVLGSLVSPRDQPKSPYRSDASRTFLRLDHTHVSLMYVGSSLSERCGRWTLGRKVAPQELTRIPLATLQSREGGGHGRLLDAGDSNPLYGGGVRDW